MRLRHLFLFCIIACMSSCKYSFRGINIPPEVKTFYVERFDNRASNVVPTLAQDFSQELIDKVRNESSLKWTETDPDIEFNGVITRYDVSSAAPQEGVTTAFNRLEIRISVEYISNKDKSGKSDWKKNFNDYIDYDSGQNILNIQDELIADINERLIEKIFQAAFTNW